MDIAKYVGLFLLKSEYCFLPGIGGLQVVKKPAAYNRDTQQISAPSYELVYDQRIGAIDDAFANFIANNERISIVHAANYLKDFCAMAKKDIREGRAVEIPGIGRFMPGPNETIEFVQDPHLHIEGRQIPYFKNSPVVEQKREEPITNIIERTTIKEPKADEEIEYKPPTVNWGKILLLSCIAIAVVVGGIFLFNYLGKSSDSEESLPETEEVSTTLGPEERVADDVTTPAVAEAPAADRYKVAIGTYNTREKAAARVAKLQSYGNQTVELVAIDSSTYYVAIGIQGAIADSLRVVDSLSTLFNPGGKVHVIHQ